MIALDGQIKNVVTNTMVTHGGYRSSECYAMTVELLTESKEKIKGKLVLGGEATQKIGRKLGRVLYVGLERVLPHGDALIGKRIEIVIE